VYSEKKKIEGDCEEFIDVTDQDQFTVIRNEMKKVAVKINQEN
jgi:hypothetical protein